MHHKGLLYDQIEAFLNGQLAGDARESMLKALAEDPELARELELRRLEFEVSESLIAQRIRDQLRGLRSPESPPPVPGRKFRRLLYWIAAMLSIAAIGVYWRQTHTIPTAPNPVQAPGHTPPVQPDVPASSGPQANQDGTKSERKNTPENKAARRHLALATGLYRRPDLETLRSAAPAANDACDLALAAWEKQDYAAVIAALQNFSDKDPKWMRALTLRAHAQFNLKRFAAASQSFSTIAESKIMPWSEEADWYALLAMLADGKADTAAFLAQLNGVLADPGHPYFEQAKALKGRL